MPEHSTVGGSSSQDGEPSFKRSDRHTFMIARNSNYESFSAGDKVICTGGWQKDLIGRARMEFVGHDFNLATGAEWLVCWLNSGKHAGWRYFKVDELQKT